MYCSCIIDIFCTLSLGTEDAPSGVKMREVSLVLWSVVKKDSGPGGASAGPLGCSHTAPTGSLTFGCKFDCTYC